MTTKTTQLSDQLAIEPSQLFVANLEKMTDFYKNQVGLEALSSDKQSVLLGYGSTGVIELVSKPKLAHAGPRDAGLFHNAILFDSRGELSRSAGKLISEMPQLFTGTGDHLVSEAFYFDDPEGNGVELYFDRPMESWQWENGRVKMDTLYIDPLQYIMKNASDQSGRDKKIGHVHLRVGDIDEARRFYVNKLGFDITALFPGALFVSVAGYHHHIGLNTWMSLGAGKRQPTLGLSEITISLGDGKRVTNLAERLKEGGTDFSLTGGQLSVDDPWGNKLTFTE